MLCSGAARRGPVDATLGEVLGGGQAGHDVGGDVLAVLPRRVVVGSGLRRMSVHVGVLVRPDLCHGCYGGCQWELGGDRVPMAVAVDFFEGGPSKTDCRLVSRLHGGARSLVLRVARLGI